LRRMEAERPVEEAQGRERQGDPEQGMGHTPIRNGSRTRSSPSIARGRTGWRDPYGSRSRRPSDPSGERGASTARPRTRSSRAGRLMFLGAVQAAVTERSIQPVAEPLLKLRSQAVVRIDDVVIDLIPLVEIGMTSRP